MEKDFVFICDYAEATGKLNALGIGFDTITAAKLPFRHPHFSLVLQLRASLVETGEKKIKVNLIDDDGKDIIPPIEGHFNIPKAESGLPSIGRFVVEFNNVEFKTYGTYSAQVLIEETEIASIYFRVIPPPKVSPTKNPGYPGG